MTTTELTDRQRRFCDLVLAGMPASRAYRTAGCRAAADGIAETNAARLIKTDQVAAYLAHHRAAAAEQVKVTLAQVLRDLREILIDKTVAPGARVEAGKLLLDRLVKSTPLARAVLPMPDSANEGDFTRRALAILDTALAGQLTVEHVRELMVRAHKGTNIAHGATLGDDMRAERPQAKSTDPAAPASDGQVIRPKWLKPVPDPTPA